MFKILEEKYASLMIKLSSERRESVSKIDFEEIDLKKLFYLSCQHELDGVIASHILKDKIIELPTFWKEKYKKEQARLTFLKNKSSEICSLMKENGISMIILKNGGIMADIEEDPAACPMEDIDSLVKKGDFLKAHEVLINNGFEFKFRSEFEKEILQEAFKDGSTEYYIPMPDGEKMWFELSWRAIAGRWIRPDKEPNTDEFFSNCYCAKDSDVGILGVEDNLLQVCVHTAKHSYVRAPGLRLHLDVERIVSNKTIDWELFLDKVKKAHVKTSTYYSLLIPKTIFNTDVPEFVLDELRPKKSKAKKIEKLLSNAGLLYPKQKKFTKIQFLKFQSSLYDSKKDAYRVLYPSFSWYKERFGVKCRILVPIYMIKRGLDLLGIRKKK